jgi:hypothetical protein
MNRFLAAMRPSTIVTVFMMAVLTYWIIEARNFAPQDRYLPLFAAITGLAMATGQLALDIRATIRRYRTPGAVEKRNQVLDIAADTDIPVNVAVRRYLQFLGWIVGVLIGIWLVGFSTALLVFVFAYLRLEGKARWTITIGVTFVVGLIQYIFFDGLLGILWPTSIFEHLTGVSVDIIPTIRSVLFDLGR